MPFLRSFRNRRFIKAKMEAFLTVTWWLGVSVVVQSNFNHLLLGKGIDTLLLKATLLETGPCSVLSRLPEFDCTCSFLSIFRLFFLNPTCDWWLLLLLEGDERRRVDDGAVRWRGGLLGVRQVQHLLQVGAAAAAVAAAVAARSHLGRVQLVEVGEGEGGGRLLAGTSARRRKK